MFISVVIIEFMTVPREISSCGGMLQAMRLYCISAGDFVVNLRRSLKRLTTFLIRAWLEGTT